MWDGTYLSDLSFEQRRELIETAVFCFDVRPVVINDSFPPILGVGFGEGAMSKETYNKIMEYLDIIENELDNIAKVVGHCGYAEFNSTETI